MVPAVRAILVEGMLDGGVDEGMGRRELMGVVDGGRRTL